MDPSRCRITLKKAFVIAIAQFSLALIFFLVYYDKINFSSIYFIDRFGKDSSNRSQITILVWTWPFGDKFPLNQCPSSFDISGCFYTQDRLLNASADAIIIHHREVCCLRENLPPNLQPHQYWVWFNLESPSNSHNLKFMNNLISLTMTYRSDSDIFSPYGFLEKNVKEEKFTIPTKSKLVAWTISNWDPKSKRVLYYEQLKQYLSIDVFGRNHQRLPSSKQQQVLSQYKFYLAFENSIHKDYITEKLWKNAFAYGCVPIVLGPKRENYERYIPKDSFIHVEDFPTAQKLAAYILQLDKDDKAYQKYFKWRATLHPVQHSWERHYCKVCKILKEAPKRKTIANLANWYT